MSYGYDQLQQENNELVRQILHLRFKARELELSLRATQSRVAELEQYEEWDMIGFGDYGPSVSEVSAERDWATKEADELRDRLRRSERENDRLYEELCSLKTGLQNRN